MKNVDPYNVVAGLGCFTMVVIVAWWGFLAWVIWQIISHAEQIGDFLIKLVHGG